MQRARRWVEADPSYEGKRLTPREEALMMLALRSLTEPTHTDIALVELEAKNGTTAAERSTGWNQALLPWQVPEGFYALAHRWWDPQVPPFWWTDPEPLTLVPPPKPAYSRGGHPRSVKVGGKVVQQTLFFDVTQDIPVVWFKVECDAHGEVVEGWTDGVGLGELYERSQEWCRPCAELNAYYAAQ